MTFNQFCKKAGLSGRYKEEFEKWCGATANTEQSEFDWDKLYTQYIRDGLTDTAGEENGKVK